MKPTHTLPESWSAPEAALDVVTVDGTAIRRAGVLSTSPQGEAITGSAAGTDASVEARSWYELLERVACVEAARATKKSYTLSTFDGRTLGAAPGASLFPEAVAEAGFRYARSNGVALHASRAAACERAYWELVERDRILRAWYGETRPLPLRIERPRALIETLTTHAVLLRELPAPHGDAWSAGLHTIAAFAFPRSSDQTLAFGYAARPSLAEAADAACAEALQMLAFLFGEPIPEPPPLAGPSAMAHLDHWLWPAHHERLRAWLEDGHTRLARSSIPRTREHPVVFADITPTWLGGGLCVIKAASPFAKPLAFGAASPFVAHLPPELRVHPIA